MTIYTNPAFYVFLASFTAFILLYEFFIMFYYVLNTARMLTTFSVPLLSTFYFLHSTQANGVRFGMYGWCLDEGGICSSIKQVNWTCITSSIAHRTLITGWVIHGNLNLRSPFRAHWFSIP